MSGILFDGAGIIYGDNAGTPQKAKTNGQGHLGTTPYDAAGAALFTGTNPGRVQMRGRPEIGTAASPFPGTDLTKVGGAALDNTWFQCRSTAANDLVIPIMAAGFRAAAIGIKCITAYDQNVLFRIFPLGDVSNVTTFGLSTGFSVTLSVGNQFYWIMQAKGVGQGGASGGATITNQAHYAVPALELAGYVVLRVQGSGGTPTVGEHQCAIVRA